MSIADTDDEGAPTAAVIGGGPAGLFAAETLAAKGVKVTVFEHRASVGRKFLLAGRGGLNITHTESAELFFDRYGGRRGELQTHIAEFDNDALRQWCAGLDEETFVGTSGRVFPKSFKATPLLRAWLRRLDDLGVTIATRHLWTGWNETGVLGFETSDGSVEVRSDVTVLALGGASWPRVSSDGSWAESLRSSGVDVRPLAAANCGIRTDWTETLSERFAGVPLKNVAVTVGDNPVSGSPVSRTAVRGDVMITSSGLEGGPIYAHSAALRDMVEAVGEWNLQIDLRPDTEEGQLAERLASTRRPKDSASTWLRRARVAPAAVAVLRDVTSNTIPTDPAALAVLLKAVPVVGPAMMPIDRAISTAGGVAFAELTDDLMLVAHPGVFVAGEMLDWEAPTGGYLLQGCFSTGAAAANGALRWLQ